jgi:hypothetical protein
MSQLRTLEAVPQHDVGQQESHRASETHTVGCDLQTLECPAVMPVSKSHTEKRDCTVCGL